jgi:hypothetical protein
MAIMMIMAMVMMKILKNEHRGDLWTGSADQPFPPFFVEDPRKKVRAERLRFFRISCIVVSVVLTETTQEMRIWI